MNKSGIVNICFTIFGITMLLTLTMIYMLYFQVGIIKNRIKEELYYALMNGQVALEREDLAVNVYSVDKNKLEQILNVWLKETVKFKFNVEEVKINELLTNTNKNEFTLKVELIVSFLPIVKISDKASVKINDEITISLLNLK